MYWLHSPAWRLTVVESDVRAGALAEAMFGAGRAYGLFVYVTVGTGISSTLVLDGRPFAGANGNALIMASSPFSVECSCCGADLKPVLEEFASGPALVARYNRHGSRVVEKAEEVTAAAGEGDRAAVMVVTSSGEALGTSVGFLVNVMDPEAIVVGGGAWIGRRVVLGQLYSLNEGAHLGGEQP